MLSPEKIQELEQLPVADAIRQLAGIYPGQLAFSTSLGLEDQVLTDIISRNRLEVTIFTLDTGRLFEETYSLLERTHARYRQPIHVYFPEASDVESFVLEKGVNSFYESTENRKTCCHIRKVKPLQRALAGAKVWITGLRAEQSVNRQEMRLLEWDEQRLLYKFNPLLHWTLEEVREYISRWNVPYNPLHDKGFISIGCAPCTRAVEPGEDARAGRWWWEQSQKECGLHVPGQKAS